MRLSHFDLYIRIDEPRRKDIHFSFVENDEYIEAGRLRSQTVRGAGYEPLLPNRSLGSLGTFVRFELSGYGVRVGELHPSSVRTSYIPKSSHLLGKEITEILLQDSRVRNDYIRRSISLKMRSSHTPRLHPAHLRSHFKL